MTPEEGQREVQNWKVVEIIENLRVNPCKTFTTMQLACIDDWTKPLDIDIPSLSKADERPSEDQKFGVSGGGHFYEAWQRIQKDDSMREQILSANPTFPLRNCQVRCFRCFVVAFGWNPLVETNLCLGLIPLVDLDLRYCSRFTCA